MGKIVAISMNTFRESIRDRVLYSLIVFSFLMLAFSILLANITIGDPIKIVKDFGLAVISLFGVLITIFVGIGLLYKEMERRTIYVILSKPITRWQFLLGKYLGLSITLAVEVFIMTFAFFCLCFYYENIISWELLKAIVPIFFELLLILSIAIVFSSFSSTFLSGLFTLSIFVIGHFTQDIKILAASNESLFFKKLSQVIYYILPNLENLNFKARVVHNLPLPYKEIFFSILYSVVYSIFLLVLAIIIFNRRNFP
ncbi:MAG: ABC transporter permease [Desulfobacterales bacterium]|nr:ABC transporter permease [Desulfobacterales bacterium]MBF0397395.1 ABC transporter permease [Desulfobacterales bacterium]